MNGTGHSLVTTFLAATVLSTHAAHAMEIWQFDKMAQSDRAEYVSELIQGAQKSLTDEGRVDDGAKIGELFNTNAPNSDVSIV